MIFNRKWRVDKEIFTRTIVDIVSDASITSSHIANGKSVPLIILDTTNHPDIEQAILFHEGVEYGHVSTIWGKSIDNKTITLTFSFNDPVRIQFLVAFDTQKQGGLIDLIINSQLLYIQPGKPKDRFSATMNNPRLMIEVPSTHFADEWRKIFNKIMTAYFREKGFSKKNASTAVDNLYKEWGMIRNFRLK